MKGPLQALFLMLALAALAQAAWQHDRLPERVAAHFGASGRADGWLSRGQQTAWHCGTVLFMTALILGAAEFPHRLPKNCVNLPHRDYWLAPERADATLNWIGSAVRLIGCALMGFFILLFHLIYRANLSAQPRLGQGIWLATGALLLVVAAVLVALFKRFAHPSAA